MGTTTDAARLGADITGFSVTVALGILGQSNENGATLQQDSLGVWQRYTAKAPQQGLFEPVKLQGAGRGSMFTVAANLLAADGVRVDLHNGAIGSTSLYLDWTGFAYMGGRQNSTAYRGKRTTLLGTSDLGHRGDLIYVNGATWEATTGNTHLVFWGDASNPITVTTAAGTGTYYSDPGVVLKATANSMSGAVVGGLVTASSSPAFPGSPVVGNTVTDGGIVWTCIHVGVRVADANNVRVCRAADDGFDPYYMCTRLRTSLMSSPVSSTKRYVYVQNGQADAGVATAIYTMALRMLGQFFGQSPYLIQPIFGLSIYYPAQLSANWDLLETSLSGGGLAATPNYATSGLTTGLVSTAYHLATPGAAITSFGFYYGQSLYRAFGTDTVSLLQPSDPHTTVDGMHQCARALAPTLSKIFRNSVA